MAHPSVALLALIGALTAPNTSPDDYPKNPNIDILHYAFSISVGDGNDIIHGRATITARFRSDGIDRLRLDLANASLDREGKGMTVTSVMSGDDTLAYSHQDDVLWITLPSPSRIGGKHAVTVTYAGVPETGLVIGPNKHGDRTFFSDNWPNRARHWLPTVDHPYDKATSEFIVTAPNHYQVISNGLAVEETDLTDGLRLTHWKQSVPIATWLYALGVARFAVEQVDTYRGKPIQTWVYAQDRDAGFYDFAIPTKAAMEFYGDMVGPFSYEKLANVQSNSVGGGMEAATAIFYGDNSVTGTRETRWRNVIIHEVAHQWFGNAVTEYDWDDVWLSEGFATYFTLLFIEHAYGRDEFVRGLERSRERVYRYYREHPDYRIVHDDLGDMGQVTSSQTYQKGGWTLHMLRGLIGDDAFWAGIQAYYRAYRDANATTDDFRRAMEEASGQDLEWFFQQWLYQGGAMVLQGGWRYDADDGILHIELAQVQDDGYRFRMPVEIGIEIDGEGMRIERVEIDELENRYSFPLEGVPTEVVLDPGVWLLAESEFARLE